MRSGYVCVRDRKARKEGHECRLCWLTLSHQGLDDEIEGGGSSGAS